LIFTSSSCMLKVQFSMQRKRFEERAQNLTFMWKRSRVHVGTPLQEDRITKCGQFWIGSIPEMTWCLTV